MNTKECCLGLCIGLSYVLTNVDITRVKISNYLLLNQTAPYGRCLFLATMMRS